MSQATIVMIILVVMSISFFIGYIPLAVTALSVPLALELTGVLKASEAWAGFSNTSVIVLIPLFMLGGVLKKTTFLEWLKKNIMGAIGGDTKRGNRKMLLLYVVSNAMTLSGAPYELQLICKGLIFLVTVAASVFWQKKG